MRASQALSGCEYVFGWLENQPHEISKNMIASVPVVVVYKDNVARQQYAAGITLTAKRYL